MTIALNLLLLELLLEPHLLLDLSPMFVTLRLFERRLFSIDQVELPNGLEEEAVACQRL